MSRGLYDALREYCESDFYPFHMPGHKRNRNSGMLADFYQMDITEIDGFDNLHQPESIIKEAQERAALLYHSKETYFLVNGSTAGILSAVSAISGKAKRLIIARNCHKAVYHAAFLNRLKLHYLYPEVIKDYDLSGPVRAEKLKELIEDILSNEGMTGQKPSEVITGIVITSPTYDGITSDVAEIAKAAHSYGLPLIVDQAHGAHFGMHPAYPENAVKEGADLVIHSVHKTLPAPTQTALIHRNGELTDKELIKKYLRIYQSSSPSYLLMAGIDEAVRIAGQEGFKRLEELLYIRNELVDALKDCTYIRICPDTEPGRLVISVKGSAITGHMLYKILRQKYYLQMEMASESYVLAILTMMDEREGFERLGKALLEIDAMLSEGKMNQGTFEEKNIWHKEEKELLKELNLHPEVSLDLWEAYLASWEEIEIKKAEGKVAAEFVNLYPPGIPLLVPGEVLNEQVIRLIWVYQEKGYTVQGIHNNKIKVINREL